MPEINLKAVRITRNVIRLLQLGKNISRETATEILEALSVVEFAGDEEVVGCIELETDDAILMTYNGRLDWIPKSVMTITQVEDNLIKFKLSEAWARLKGAV